MWSRYCSWALYSCWFFTCSERVLTSLCLPCTVLWVSFFDFFALFEVDLQAPHPRLKPSSFLLMELRCIRIALSIAGKLKNCCHLTSIWWQYNAKIHTLRSHFTTPATSHQGASLLSISLSTRRKDVEVIRLPHPNCVQTFNWQPLVNLDEQLKSTSTSQSQVYSQSHCPQDQSPILQNDIRWHASVHDLPSSADTFRVFLKPSGWRIGLVVPCNAWWNVLKGLQV